MNQRAAALGLTGTHFMNRTPAQPAALLHRLRPRRDRAPGHDEPTFARSSARARRRSRGPASVGAQADQPQPAALALGQVRRGEDRYTKQAGRSLAASSTIDHWRLICVVLKCDDSWTDARTCWNGAISTIGPAGRAAAGPAHRAVHRGASRFVEARRARSCILLHVTTGLPARRCRTGRLRGP